MRCKYFLVDYYVYYLNKFYVAIFLKLEITTEKICNRIQCVTLIENITINDVLI